MTHPKHLWRRPGRWLRRTGWLLAQMRADLGLGAGTGPVWLRDNPFLVKSSRTETRRLGLMGRLLAVVVILGGLTLGGLALQNRDPAGTASFTGFLFGSSLPVVLFVVVSFVHVLFISNARTALSVSLAEEARRGTLPDLLITPLRRAEMLLAMGVGPARSAFLVALAGLPIYLLLEQFGGLLPWEIVCLYVLFGLLCYQPPIYAVPALSGLAQTPEALPGQFAALPNRRAARRVSYAGIGFPLVLGFLLFGQVLGTIGGGWLTHLFSALNLSVRSGFSFLVVFSWPYYAVQLLSSRLPFFHGSVSPLFYVLPLMAMQWAGSVLSSGAALSSGDLKEMNRLPLWTRAQTLSRWTARLAGFCLLAVVWRAWVESGDTGSLASDFAAGLSWNAAGLLLLLAGFSLPNVCARAQAVDPRSFPSQELRAPASVLRRALKRSLRPLGVASGVFLAACAIGGLSPFAVPVYQLAGKIALVGISTVFWAVGLRRALPRLGKWASFALLYGLPVLALSTPGLSLAAAASPASAWVRLFAGGPALVTRFPFWHLEALPSLWVCAAGPFLAGLALIAGTSRRPKHAVAAKPVPAKRIPTRNERQTAVLMDWITTRVDNPLFTYEMRVRTRSGRWFDWLLGLPLLFTVGVVTALEFPSFVPAFLSPFHFFEFSSATGGNGAVFLELTSLLLLGQCYVLFFRGPAISQELISKDRQSGTWGGLLISPLTIKQIFWGKVFGQTMVVCAWWAGSGLACLLLYGLSSPLVGAGPALAAWASGQIFAAALFTLGVGVGVVVATFPRVQKTFRGFATLLLVLIVGGSVYLQFQWVPLDMPGDWRLLASRLLGGGIFALLLSALLIWLAQWRLTRLRQGDIAFGDGTG